MTKQYQGDVVLMTCYLINGKPPTILGVESPQSILVPQEFVFSLPPHIFGCVSFVHQHSPCFSKLEPKAIKCIFLC